MLQRPLEIITLRPQNEIGVAVHTHRFEEGYLTSEMTYRSMKWYPTLTRPMIGKDGWTHLQDTIRGYTSKTEALRMLRTMRALTAN